MGVEEKTQQCSSTSPSGVGFGRSSSNSSKKTNGNNNNNSSSNNKQKKVPQRGLGVAQLEKIRLEEQHKETGSVLTPPTTTSPTTKSILAEIPNRHYNSVSFPSSLDLPSPNSLFRGPNSDIVRKQNSENGFEMMPRHNIGIAKLWNGPNCEYNGCDHNKESGATWILDPGFAFRPSLNNLPSFDHSNLIWTLPNFQRTQPPSTPPPPPPPPPALVNVSSASSILSSSPSVLNFHTEPPSNQSYYSNNYSTPMWSDDERMIGVKRPCPFSQENDASSFDFKLPAFVVPPMQTDETTSCGKQGGIYNLDLGRNSMFREGPTCSTSIADSNSKIGVKENGSANGEFLTLAPPASNTCPSQKFSFPPGYLAFHNPEVPDFASFPYQESSEDTIFQPGASGSNPRQVFYTFIPPAKAQLVRSAATMNICNGDVGESVNLNLKL